MPKCDRCDYFSNNSETLKSHSRDKHINVVYYGESLTAINRIEGAFTCPKCKSKITTTRSFIGHLEKHELKVALERKRKTKQNDSSNGPVAFDLNEPTVPLTKARQTITSSNLTNSDVVLITTDAMNSDKAIQEDKLMLAKLGRWTPVIYHNNNNNNQYGMLTSSSIAGLILSEGETTGTWRSPINDDVNSSSDVVEVDRDYHIKHLKQASKASNRLAETVHEELTPELTDILNQDWLQFPQLRYCTSQLLAGAILVEGQESIIINTIEPYARDIVTEAHHERRSFGVGSSFPATPSKYGFLRVCNIPTSDGLKLVIGSRTCNFLITSSFRLDILSVNLGPSTTHFTASENTRVFLDVHSIDSCNINLSNSRLSRSQSLPCMYMLRQLRSKFDRLSTYTMCRASSMVASELELQPVTIWTLSDQQSNSNSKSQEKIASLFFREIAIQVIKDGEKAILDLKSVEKLMTKTKKETRIDKILTNIQTLFKDQDHITIIDNTELNRQLTDLADIIKNKKENDKKLEDITKALYN